ncbi:hypothetical protein BC826DRAFT_905944, partial [Russula brevipes]
TPDRLLLDAARTDNVDQLLEVFAKPKSFDINYQDGTALHYAALSGSVDCLNELLEYDGCDVDYTNQLEGLTPLHFAVKIAEPALRALIVDSLLDAGADTRFIKDKAGLVPLDYVPEDDTETRNAFERNQAQPIGISESDIAEYDEDADEFSESGSSGSEDEK